LLQDGKAIHFGEHDVEDDDVMFAVTGVPEGGVAIGGFIDGIACFAEALDKGFAEWLEIFYYEESHMFLLSIFLLFYDTRCVTKAKS
jgi:hypothetical protein